MAAPRRFDYDEARRLRFDEGLTYAEIGRRLGVAPRTVKRAVAPGHIEKHAAQQSDWGKGGGTCPKCGAPIHRRTELRGGQCVSCGRAKQAEQVRTSVKPRTLRCSACRKWKRDEAFSPAKSKPQRRGRSAECRSCTAARKRAARNSG